ncbi:hypothetical protein C8A01DRAFT_41937 [Parachaetomium inaequale]|uniref:Uncharacterized protein n=1 Tax=Parachaetomium inaequale TaxID=2588326 RepID=A0AAN6P4K3_9PEZI|nr:hypothetical protein C8A01DRAFT_41937 [Parachaetomium inaequale]
MPNKFHGDDVDRLPPRMKRTGYDADTGQYTYTTEEDAKPHHRLGSGPIPAAHHRHHPLHTVAPAAVFLLPTKHHHRPLPSPFRLSPPRPSPSSKPPSFTAQPSPPPPPPLSPPKFKYNPNRRFSNILGPDRLNQRKPSRAATLAVDGYSRLTEEEDVIPAPRAATLDVRSQRRPGREPQPPMRRVTVGGAVREVGSQGRRYLRELFISAMRRLSWGLKRKNEKMVEKRERREEYGDEEE